jgi:hypothetical protein
MVKLRSLDKYVPIVVNVSAGVFFYFLSLSISVAYANQKFEEYFKYDAF